MAADLERRVNLLDNDVQAIYEMLSGIEGTQRRHGNRLSEIGEQLTTVSVRLDAVSGRLDSIGSVQTEHGAKLDEHGAKLDTILELLRERR